MPAICFHGTCGCFDFALSQGGRFGEDPSLQIRTQTILCQYVNFPAQELLEILLEPNYIQERPACLDVHEQVEVAVGPIVTSCDGSEDTHVACAVACGDLEDFLSAADERCRGHALQ